MLGEHPDQRKIEKALLKSLHNHKFIHDHCDLISYHLYYEFLHALDFKEASEEAGEVAPTLEDCRQDIIEQLKLWREQFPALEKFESRVQNRI